MYYADMHCDTLTALPPSAWSDGDGQVSFAKLRKASCGLQCFAVFLHFDKPHLFDTACDYADKLSAAVAQCEWMVPVCNARQAQDAVAQGKTGAMLTLEEGGIIEGDLDKLRRLHRLGVRMMTLTWNFANQIGFPNLDYTQYSQNRLASLSRTDMRPLTPFGREVVAEMNRIGMIVDVSHLSDGGFWDVVHCCAKPFVASHSNARAVCGVARNLTDDMLVALSAKGGVTGLNLCPDFLTDKGEDLLEVAVLHAEHIWQVAGEDVLAIGTDFDGIAAKPPLEGCQKMPTLYEALCRRLTPRVVDKMMGHNFMRVLQDVCGQ